MWLVRRFVLRQLAREPVRPLGTVLGVALGIAVVVAVRLANASSIRGFETALETMAGRTSLEVTGPAGGVDEGWLAGLEWLRDYGAVSPVIEGDALWRPVAGRGELLRVLGIDILRDQPFRDYDVLELGTRKRPSSAREFLALLLDPVAVIVTEQFARRHGLRTGDALPVIVADRERRLVIRGLLSARGPARALDGNVAIMDIAAAQWALDRLGRIDRLDILLHDARGVDRAEREIAARLPAGLMVQRPARRGAQVERMLAAFHANLAALSLVALLVGLFLVYNTVSISVVARREEIGMLRAAGATRGHVVMLFLAEAAALGAAGCALGVAAGRALAHLAIALTATTVNVLYIAAAAAPPSLAWADVGVAFALGTMLALAAAAAPAWEASRVPPIAAIRGADRLVAAGRSGRRTLVVSAALFGLGGWLARLGPIHGVPVPGFAAAFSLVFAAAFAVPSVLRLLARAGRAPLSRAFGIGGLLANANLAAAVPRLSISVAALAVSLSMMVAIAIMIGSFRHTVIYWVEQTLRADLYVSAAARGAGARHATISAEVEAVVRGLDGVAAVDAVRTTPLVYRHVPIVLNALDFGVLSARGGLLYKAPADGDVVVARAAGRDEVVVSETFANRFDVGPGDTIELPTAHGAAPFQVAAVFYDYSSDRGVIDMDRSTFAKHFGELRPSGLGVYLDHGVAPQAARTALADALPPDRQVHVYTNAALRGEVLRIFDSTFAITYALEVIAIAVAIMGVAGTLVTLVLERRRELATLRLVGATRRQVRHVVVLEAIMMGGVSQAIGLGVGVLLSLLLIRVINVQSFGWTIQFVLPVALLTQMSVVILLATAVAGLVPAHRASRQSMAADVSEE